MHKDLEPPLSGLGHETILFLRTLLQIEFKHGIPLNEVILGDIARDLGAVGDHAHRCEIDQPLNGAGGRGHRR